MTTFNVVKLGEIAEVKGGKRLPKGHDFSISETNHLYIRARDIGMGKIFITEPVYIEENTFRFISNYTVSEGEVVVTIVGANIGDVGFISSNFSGANLTENAAKVTVNRKLCNPIFLKFCLANNYTKARFQYIASGAAQGKLGLFKIKNFDICLPSLFIQDNIAAILSNYDNLIENNRRRIELLEESAKLLYQEWFVHLRFPGYEHVKIVDGLPEGWNKTFLGELLEISKGKNITKETITDGNIPVVAGGLQPAYFHNVANTNGPVITISASGANAGYINLYHEDIWASDCSYISKDNTKHIYYYYLQLKNRQLEVFGMQKGAAQPHVYPKDLARLPVFEPLQVLLIDFEDIVSGSFNLIKNLLNQNKKLTQARDMLLPRLMNGEISV